MALAWTMDKPGPLCRNADDCAIVFNAIRGRDPADPSTIDEPFPYDAGTPLSRLRIGYIKSAFDATHVGADLDRKVLEVLRTLGARLVPIELPQQPVDELRFVLSAEAAAAFEPLITSGQVRELVEPAARWAGDAAKTVRFAAKDGDDANIRNTAAAVSAIRALREMNSGHVQTLAKFANHVTLVHRREEFRASPIMIDYAHAKANLEFVTNAVVTEVVQGHRPRAGRPRCCGLRQISQHRHRPERAAPGDGPALHG